MSIKVRLIIMNFLQFAVWGSYLTSMGSYLANIGMGENIGLFYAMQGIVSLFMPAILGIIADRWIPAQKLLSISHFLAAFFMVLAGYYGMTAEPQVSFPVLFSLYSLSVAFYMPTLALSNSVAYTALDQAGLDTIKYFPPIRIFGTIGFICSMWLSTCSAYRPVTDNFMHVPSSVSFMEYTH
ncbi:nucleoside permease NupG [Bacteroides pyogenes JCM 6292]|uniref:Nucleoside permease NupG n=2 Tax=Bacteroides pyogenes TaxID=310300 RepID=W4PG14_9BACE|nr:nucleoside permease NupG [Bacteroides pyogenes JCM 6292]GAE18348.1 nucleoside permease NupG [Bacteroides pyogenes DSM 20611 = JCM 6294]